MAWGSIPCPSLPSTPVRQLQASLTQGVPRGDSNRCHCTPPQACPGPEAKVLYAISGFPVSTATCKGPPSLSQPRSPRQGFSLTASTRAGCRKDAWQQAQACSFGGCLRSLLSSMSCNALRGPRQHHPSLPAPVHPFLLCAIPPQTAVTSLQSHKHLSLGETRR